MAFDLNAAAKDAAALFDEFKAALDKTDDANTIEIPLIVKVETTLEQSTKALKTADMFGADITINPDIKSHISEGIDQLLSNESNLEKMKILEETTGTSLIEPFTELKDYLSD